MADTSYTYSIIGEVNKEKMDAEYDAANARAMADFNLGKPMKEHYAQDAVFLAGAKNKVVQGNEAISGIYEGLSGKFSDWSFKPIHRTYLPDAIGEVGTFYIVRKDTGEAREGKYSGLTVKKNGRWVCQYDIVGDYEH